MTHIFQGNDKRAFMWAVLFFLCGAALVVAQPSQGALRGQVADALGGVVVGATVTTTDAAGVEKTATTDEEGRYAFPALAPGRYVVRAHASGFTPYENLSVEVAAGRAEPLDISLTVAIEEEVVTVTAEADVSADPEANAGAVVLRGTDLDALPDDPEGLAEALQALAGPAAGVDGEAQIYLDGFTGGRLPPKESIREIRVNRNPFSAEYDRLGYGRVEIFTKPGTDKLRGQTFFNFNDESLNSRSPFAAVRAPYQSRRYGGNLSGPIVAKRASFFFDFERSETDDNQDINAVILDSSLNSVPFTTTVLTPTRRTSFSPRLDWQLNPTNTLVARYEYERSSRANSGVGGFNLPERGYDTETTQQTARLTETAILNHRIVNETRFQYARERRRQEGGALAPTIRVNDSFTGGGAQVGLSANDAHRIELQNYTSWAQGSHSLKAGARLRSLRLRDESQQNFAGTFTFTSLEQYRQTLLDVAGARPTQFSLAAGDPVGRVTQTDFSPFIQDDWRARPELTLSAGLRYDRQTNIESGLNFAPRLAFAWQPRAGAGGGQRRQQQATVIRGGFGVFYDRFGENLLLQAERFDGVTQQQYLVTNATEAGRAILDQVAFTRGGVAANAVPSIATLQAFATSQTVRRLAANLRAPYTLQTALSVERQLPYRTTLSVNFINARTLHALRTRNVNAPLTNEAGLPVRDGAGNLVRPFAGRGNIFEYESSGVFNQQQLIVSLNNRFSNVFSFSSSYTWNRARSDTDGAFSFPVNQYDLAGEYGRSAQDIRHRFSLFGTINAPWGVRLNPALLANTGRPFNITTGRDTNADTLFNERPAFADAQTPPCPAGANPLTCDFRRTPLGDFDANPKPGQAIIPRNYGTGPSFFVVNLRVSKTFGFGQAAATVARNAGRNGGGAQGGGGGGRGGAGGGRGGRVGGGRGARGGGGGFGGGGGRGEGGAERRYNLTFSVNAQNLLNNTNEGVSVGNLRSPFFGQSVTTAGGFGRGGGGNGDASAGNRRIELQMRLSF
jgi:hypothetical protein